MRCAVFAATRRGAELALRLRERLPADGFGVVLDVFLKEGRAPDVRARRFLRLADSVAAAFRQYDALIFFMAAGIAVRMIAPHLQSKLTDPAVIVADEGGRHVVSLLSGHVGGGNALTLRVASCLGAEPVITTATDVRGLSAPDALAAELGLRPVPKAMIQAANGALLESGEVSYAVDAALSRLGFFEEALRKRGIPFVRMAAADAVRTEKLLVFITEDDSLCSDRLLALVPRRLVAGIGCRRGVSKERLKAVLADACERIGQELPAVSVIASAEIKRDEAGLLALAEEIGAELRFFDSGALQGAIKKYGLEESAFVQSRIGVGNVCEAAALCCVGRGRMALPKTKWEKATVALAWER